MKVIKGKQLDELQGSFEEIRSKYQNAILEIGCGDGRYLYRNAKESPGTFFVGVEPNHKQLEQVSNKAYREKLPNLVYVLSSFEDLPANLNGQFTEVVILLPWGSLLAYLVKNPLGFAQRIIKLRATGGLRVRVVFGFNPQLEPSETSRLNLSYTENSRVRDTLIESFLSLGATNTKNALLDSKSLKELGTPWSKKISANSKRSIYDLSFEIK
jgi:16S rRNA (adenine(1408)-N(1))-methyltransferase